MLHYNVNPIVVDLIIIIGGSGVTQWLGRWSLAGGLFPCLCL